jgi:hypothetical protein
VTVHSRGRRTVGRTRSCARVAIAPPAGAGDYGQRQGGHLPHRETRGATRNFVRAAARRRGSAARRERRTPAAQLRDHRPHILSLRAPPFLVVSGPDSSTRDSGRRVERTVTVRLDPRWPLPEASNAASNRRPASKRCAVSSSARRASAPSSSRGARRFLRILSRFVEAKATKRGLVASHLATSPAGTKRPRRGDTAVARRSSRARARATLPIRSCEGSKQGCQGMSGHDSVLLDQETVRSGAAARSLDTAWGGASVDLLGPGRFRRHGPLVCQAAVRA